MGDWSRNLLPQARPWCISPVSINISFHVSLLYSSLIFMSFPAACVHIYMGLVNGEDCNTSRRDVCVYVYVKCTCIVTFLLILKEG